MLGMLGMLGIRPRLDISFLSTFFCSFYFSFVVVVVVVFRNDFRAPLPALIGWFAELATYVAGQ